MNSTNSESGKLAFICRFVNYVVICTAGGQFVFLVAVFCEHCVQCYSMPDFCKSQISVSVLQVSN